MLPLNYLNKHINNIVQKVNFNKKEEWQNHESYIRLLSDIKKF